MKLDQLSDTSNLQLYRLLQGVELPDFVKDAEIDTDASVEPLEKTAFADQVNIAFPINTPPRVYVSNAFFQAKKAEMEDRYGSAHVAAVSDKLKEAAELFSISREIEAYNFLAEKRANRDYEVVHVCTINDPSMDPQEIPLFPVKTAGEFSKSAQVFVDNIGNYPFEWREQIAQSFLAKAATFGVDELPDLVCKYAGLFYPVHTIDMATELNRRANKMDSKEAKEKLDALAIAVEDAEFESVEDVMKIAHIVHCVEFQDGAYTRSTSAGVLPDPVDVFFSLPPQKVAEMLNVVEMAGEKYPMEMLKKVSADRYKEAFGIDIDPTNEDQLRDVLPTMPLSDVSLFRELTGACPI